MLVLGLFLGVAGASFAAALPLASRWYPAEHQGTAMGIAGAGNSGTALAACSHRAWLPLLGWTNVFGIALIPLVLVLIAFCFMAKDAPDAPPPKTLAEYMKVLKDKDAWWFMFFYSVTFGGFVGLASSLVIYFNTQYGLDPKMAGFFTAGCVFAGSLVRPIGGNVADRIGGVKSLTVMYIFAAIFLAIVSFGLPEAWMALVVFVCAMLSLGMGNGAVFQLVPQRFKKEIGVMTGLVGMAGGVGGILPGLQPRLRQADDRQLPGRVPDLRRPGGARPGWPDRGQDPLAHHLGRQPPDDSQDLRLFIQRKGAEGAE